MTKAGTTTDRTTERSDQVDAYRRAFSRHILADDPPPAAGRWRLKRFERGLKLADEIESRADSLAGKRILEIGSAFGGDICGLAARGAACVATDLFDHRYAELSSALPNDLAVVRSDCTRAWPFADQSFDVVVSFSVIEVVDDLDRFFAELLRVLKPDGVALVDTGTALRMARNDPLYHLPLISLLPTPMRRFIAERVFRRRYRMRVADHTFYSAASVRRLVADRCCSVTPATYARNRWIRRVSRLPGSRIWSAFVRHFVFDFVLIRKSGGAGASIR